MVLKAVMEILRPQKEDYVAAAVRCGLVAGIKPWSRTKDVHVQSVITFIIGNLCVFPQAFEKMREEGVYPAVLLDLADSPHPAVVFLLGSVMARVPNGCTRYASYTLSLGPVVELIAAGFVKRLKQAWREKFQQDPAYGEKLRVVIAELEGLAERHAGAIKRWVRDRPIVNEQLIVPSHKVRSSVLVERCAAKC